MVINGSNEKVQKDFMSYYKRREEEELYFVSINHPKLIEHLEEYLDKSMN